MLFCAWILSVLLAGSLWASPSGTPPKEIPLRQPTVRTVFPLGGKTGGRIQIEIEGEFLDRASAVLCECPDLRGTIRQAGALTLAVDIDIPASAEPGVRVMYVESPRGTSNRFFFRVTRWNSLREAEPNDQLDEAQVITTPALIEGRIARLTDVDFFKFHANGGERLAFNVLAARTKAPGFVSIAVLDSNGREIVRK